MTRHQVIAWGYTILFVCALPLTWIVALTALCFHPAGFVAGVQSLCDMTATAAQTVRRLHR